MRFKLRTLLILITLAAVSLGLWSAVRIDCHRVTEVRFAWTGLHTDTAGKLVTAGHCEDYQDFTVVEVHWRRTGKQAYRWEGFRGEPKFVDHDRTEDLPVYDMRVNGTGLRITWEEAQAIWREEQAE